MTCPSDNNRMVPVTVYNTPKSEQFQVHHKDCRDNKKERETANNWWEDFVMVGKLPTGDKFPTAKMVAMNYSKEDDREWTEDEFKLHNCVEHKH